MESATYHRIVFVFRLSAIGDVIMTSALVAKLEKLGYFPVLITHPGFHLIAERMVGLKACATFEPISQTWRWFHGPQELHHQEFTCFLKNQNQKCPPVAIDVQRTRRSQRAQAKFIEVLPMFAVERLFQVEKRTFKRIFLLLKAKMSVKQRVTTSQGNQHQNGEVRKKLTSIYDLHQELIHQLCLWDQKPLPIESIYPQLNLLKKGFLAEKAPQGYVCLFPGASHATKVWPTRHSAVVMEQILAKTPWVVVICGSLADEPLAKELMRQRNQNRVLNLCGQTNLGETLDLIAEAKFVISNDSFAAHAADAHQVPGVMLFGPTTPAFGFLPRSPLVKVISLGYSCSPCSRHGSAKCPWMNHKCLEELPPELVLEHVFNYIGSDCTVNKNL